MVLLRFKSLPVEEFRRNKMINKLNNKSHDFYTEGFGVTFPEPFSVKVDSGKLCYITTKELIEQVYPVFEFDVVPSLELPVVYDVHLLPYDLETPIQVDRTEIGDDVLAFYVGKEELQHTLLSFMVMPKHKSLEEVEMKFNNVEVILP